MKIYPIALTIAAQIPLSGFIVNFFILMKYKNALLIQGKSIDIVQGDITLVLFGMIISLIASIGVTITVWMKAARRKAKMAAMKDLKEVIS